MNKTNVDPLSKFVLKMTCNLIVKYFTNISIVNQIVRVIEDLGDFCFFFFYNKKRNALFIFKAFQGVFKNSYFNLLLFLCLF